MPSYNFDFKNFNVDEIFEDGEDENEFTKITNSIVEEVNQKNIDEELAKRNEDWGTLANQVVGSESR